MVKVVASEELKRPMSAYFLWMNANREKITAAAGSTSGPAVSKKAAEMWKAASDAEKKPFEEQNKQQKEKYDAYLKTPEGEAALKALKEERKEAKQDDVKKAMKKAAKAVEKDDNLKRPMSAYFLWLNASREKIAAAAGTTKGAAVSKQAAEMWKTVSAAEKKPFEEEAKKQKEKYDAYLKTPEGEAAQKALKEAQKAAKAEVKGSDKLDGPQRKRKAAEMGA
eukprot:TRINITY_DN455_c0_g1_i1.p1 TRINITY_DN455_c0_g1~~TRINITY_DN455_c0_g1_i1.p1  ORF type:complete len:246 (-),score=100.00 TRINITY_DN455_c0_g1_i1:253-921(-)